MSEEVHAAKTEARSGFAESTSVGSSPNVGALLVQCEVQLTKEMETRPCDYTNRVLHHVKEATRELDARTIARATPG